MSAFWGFVVSVLRSAVNMISSASVWMLLSFAIAGIMHEVLDAQRVRKSSVCSSRVSGVFFSTVSGMLIPICSCGSIPLGIGLYYSGAYLGPTLAFMTSSPMINPISIILAYGLLGKEIATVYLITGFVAPMIIGVVANRFAGPELHRPQEDGAGAALPLTMEKPTLLQMLKSGMRWSFGELAVMVSKYTVSGMLLASLFFNIVPQSYIQRHPDRLLYPMKRVGKRGEGRFRRISWEQAVDEICRRLEDCGERPESTLMYVGHPKWFRSELTAFANAYGTPNLGTESSTCFRAMAMGWRACYGKGPIPVDLANCKTLLLWGVNPAYSNTPTSDAYLKAVERGMQMVVVDPRRTPFAKRAALHLRPRPGTDGALALGLGHVIVEEGLWDQVFVERHTSGFGAYREYVKQFAPARTQALTGVPGKDIVAAARLYAGNGPGAIQLSASPVVHHRNGVQNVRAISLLCALTGNYGIPGGNTPPIAPAVDLSGNFMGGNTRVHAQRDLSHRAFPVWSALVPGEIQVTPLADYLEGRGAYPVETLLAFGMNHRMWPRPDRLEQALEGVGFFANVDLFMTETARYADILLPAATSFEREQVISLGPDTVYCQPRVIQPMGEVKNDLEILLLLARRMGYREGVLGLESYEDYLRYLLSPTGVDLEELRSSSRGMQVRQRPPAPTEQAIFTFPTASGKIEFLSSALTACGEEGLPVYHPPLNHTDFPLTLCTGCRKPQLFHSRTYRMPWLAGLERLGTAELHPLDAKNLGVCDGDAIWVTTPVGRLPLHARLDGNGLPGVVHMYHGNGDKDANLLVDDRYLDPLSGFPGYKSYVCRVERREEDGPWE